MIKKLLASVCLITTGAAHATLIEYAATNLGGTTWEYEYTITNDTLGFDIEEFTIYFDFTLFDNLALGGSPAGWDPLVIQRDLNLPDDGFYDALALAGGIAAGATLGGFSVTFDFLGAGAPGAQFFEIVDAFNFDTLDSGMTTLAPDPQPVPEPGVLLLLGVALLAGWSVRRRRTAHALGVVLVAGVLATSFAAPTVQAAGALRVDDMELVDRTRVGRTTYNYTYRLIVTNTAPVALTDITVYVGQTPSQPDADDTPQELSLPQRDPQSSYAGPGTQILEDVVEIGTVPAGATVTSTDTFTIQQDRQFQLDPDALITEAGYTASVLLRGVVRDLPISFAEVEVTVDRSESGRPIIESGRPIIEVYRTTADEEGRYELSVDFVADPDFVSIKANGVDQQSFVELNSIVGSAGTTLEEATVAGVARNGPGLIVDGTDFNPLNVTHISTALTALATEANGGQGFTNDAALAAAQAQVSNDNLVRVAAAIKTVIDNPQVSLPPGVANTADLLNDAVVFDNFVMLLEQDFPDQFQAALDSTIDDFNVNYVFSEVPQTMYVALVRNDPLQTGARVFTFEQTGDAQVVEFIGETTDADWSVDAEGHIQVALNNSAEFEFFTQREVPPGSGNFVQVRALQRTTNYELVRIAVGVQSDQILIGRTEVTTFPDHVGVLPDEVQTFEPSPDFSYLAFGTDGILGYTAAELNGRTFAQEYFHTDNNGVGLTNESLGADLLSFAAGGTGTTSRRNFTFSWSIGADGILQLTFANGDTSTYARYARINGGQVDRTVLVGRYGDGEVGARDANNVVTTGTLQFTEAELIDKKYRSGRFSVNEATLLSFDLGRFDFNFFSEGVGCRDGFGYLVDFSWVVDENGYMVAQRFFDDKSGPVLWLQRSWLPAAIVPGINGTRYWLIENRDQDFSGDPNFPSDPTETPGRINFYEVVQDLSENSAPTPVDDELTLSNFDPIHIDLVANDIDPDGDIVILTGLGGAPVGTVDFQFDENGAIDGVLYTPPLPGIVGVDSFSYTISDSTCNAGTAIGNVTIQLPGFE